MSQSDNNDAAILATVGAYYTDKLRVHGTTARGADWKNEQGQEKRFAQLLRAVEPGRVFSLGEIGCGYGALVSYLVAHGYDATYKGCDVSEEMVQAARGLYGSRPRTSFVVGSELGQPADYVVSSGIFNVRFGFDDAAWLAYCTKTVDSMLSQARVAIAFNVLTGFADAHRKETRLWYPDPGELLNRLLQRYGLRVALLHDYDLYEYTISIRVSERNQE